MRASASHALGAFEPSRLEVRWERRATNILENLRVVVSAPRGVWALPTAESFFRLRVSPTRRRGWELTGSLVCHAFLLLAALAISPMVPPPKRHPLPEVHITWYGMPRDVVPKIAPLRKQSRRKAKARRKHPKQQEVTRRYNPHTTVVFQPPHATNLRQLLIEPQAPPRLPRFLPAMPNVIQWEAAAPPRPAIAIHPNQLRAVRGRESEQARLRAPRISYRKRQGPMDLTSNPSALVTPPPILPPKAIHRVRTGLSGDAAAAAPVLVSAAPAGGQLAFTGEKGAAPAPPLPSALGAIHATRAATAYVAAQGSPAVDARSLGASKLHLPATSGAIPFPSLPSAPKAVRAHSSNGFGSSMAAPGIRLAAGRLVSLSLSPEAEPQPPGNAYAPMSIGPHPGGKGRPAAPNFVGRRGSGEAPGFPSPKGSATGPEGLLILHDTDPPAPPPVPQPSAPALPKPARVAPVPAAAASPRRMAPVPAPMYPALAHGLSQVLPGAHNVLLIGVILQDPVNRLDGAWQLPTLGMNVPGLSRSRGTWVLDFADPMPAALRKQISLIVPTPEGAVQPQYPAALRQEGVRGQVVLRAVIGRNGRVNHIRLIERLNSVLDQKAEAAFSRWKFGPALLNGKPIAMPVVVTVPFLYIPASH